MNYNKVAHRGEHNCPFQSFNANPMQNSKYDYILLSDDLQYILYWIGIIAQATLLKKGSVKGIKDKFLPFTVAPSIAQIAICVFFRQRAATTRGVD